jgi:hypothetical protein
VARYNDGDLGAFATTMALTTLGYYHETDRLAHPAQALIDYSGK